MKQTKKPTQYTKSCFEEKVELTKLAGLRNIPPDKQDGFPILFFGLGQQHE